MQSEENQTNKTAANLAGNGDSLISTLQNSASGGAVGGGARSASAETLALYELLREVILDAKLTPAEKKTLIDELRKSTPASDRWTFRWAIWILGLVVLVTIVALWSLSAGTGNIPDGLVAIGSAAAGGLAGLLTPGRGRE